MTAATEFADLRTHAPMQWLTLCCWAGGMTVRQTALSLFISDATVATHRKQLRRKKLTPWTYDVERGTDMPGNTTEAPNPVQGGVQSSAGATVWLSVRLPNTDGPGGPLAHSVEADFTSTTNLTEMQSYVIGCARGLMAQSVPLIQHRDPRYSDKPYPRHEAPALLTAVLDAIEVDDGPTCQWGTGADENGCWDIDYLVDGRSITLMFFPAGYDD